MSLLRAPTDLSDLELVCLMLVAVVPLVILPAAAHPVELPKAVLLQSGALLLLVLLAVDLSRARGRRPPRDEPTVPDDRGGRGRVADPTPAPRPPRRIRGTRRPLALAAALGVTVAVAGTLGPDPTRSWLGDLDRMAGVLTWWSHLVVFAALALVGLGPAARRRFRLAMVTAGVLVAVYALLQTAGLDPLRWTGDARSPAGASLGRSNFAGALLAMTLPLALSVVPTARRRWRALVVLALLLVGGGLLASAARAAWLGAAVGCAVALLVPAGRRSDRVGRASAALGQARSRRSLRAVALAAAIVLVVGVALVGWTVTFETGLADDPSLAARVTTWRSSGPHIAARPLFGYGPDTLALVLPTLWTGARVDRAHSLPLDLVLQLGLIGLGLYGALVVTVLRRAVRHAPRDAEDAWLRRGMLGSLAAFLAAGLLSFGVAATWLWHWALLGLLVGARPREARHAPALGAGGARRGGAVVAVALVAFLPALAVPTSVLAADVAANRAERLVARGHPAAPAAAARAVRLAPYRPDYRLGLARAHLVAAVGAPNGAGREAAAEAAATAARAAVARGAADAYVQLAAAEIYLAAADLTGNAARHAAADRAFARAAALDARLAAAPTGRGRVALQTGRPADAVRYLEAAVAIDEAFAPAWRHLGAAHLVRDRPYAAAEAYARAVANDPAVAASWLGHARALCRVGKWVEGRMKLARGARLDPAHPALPATRAACRTDRQPDG